MIIREYNIHSEGTHLEASSTCAVSGFLISRTGDVEGVSIRHVIWTCYVRYFRIYPRWVHPESLRSYIDRPNWETRSLDFITQELLRLERSSGCPLKGLAVWTSVELLKLKGNLPCPNYSWFDPSETVIELKAPTGHIGFSWQLEHKKFVWTELRQY